MKGGEEKGYVKELVMGVGVAVVMVMVQRAVSGPDFVKGVKMRVAWGIKRYAEMQRVAWGRVEGMASDFYEIQRL